MVSVIVPNYNHAAYLPKRFDSIFNQTFQDFEVIILDDYSTDNSRQIIEQYKNHPKVSHVLYNQINSGSPFKQWEKGIELAKGEYVWIAESDDWCEHNFLQSLMEPVLKNSQIGICFCDSFWVDDEGKAGKDLSLYHQDFHLQGFEEIKRSLLTYNSIQNASAVLMKSSLVKASISKILEYKSCGDWILYLLILQDSELVYISKKMNYFRWYHNNVSNQSYKKGLWVKEGVDVLRNINFKKVELSLKEIIIISFSWLNKIINAKGVLRFSERLTLYKKVLLFILNYFKA